MENVHCVQQAYLRNIWWIGERNKIYPTSSNKPKTDTYIQTNRNQHSEKSCSVGISWNVKSFERRYFASSPQQASKSGQLQPIFWDFRKSLMSLLSAFLSPHFQTLRYTVFPLTVIRSPFFAVSTSFLFIQFTNWNFWSVLQSSIRHRFIT